MATTVTSAGDASARRVGHRSHFLRHFAEMIVAMMVGMAIGRLVFTGIFATAGMTYEETLDRYTAPCLLMMAFNMSVPMIWWMRHRGHAWRSAWEMAAAMFVPAFALVGLLWAHVMTSEGPVFPLLHAAMIPAMLIVMFLRREEYAGRISQHAAHVEHRERSLDAQSR